jgi:hypothetical protein
VPLWAGRSSLQVLGYTSRGGERIAAVSVESVMEHVQRLVVRMLQAEPQNAGVSSSVTHVYASPEWVCHRWRTFLLTDHLRATALGALLALTPVLACDDDSSSPPPAQPECGGSSNLVNLSDLTRCYSKCKLESSAGSSRTT